VCRGLGTKKKKRDSDAQMKESARKKERIFSKKINCRELIRVKSRREHSLGSPAIERRKEKDQITQRSFIREGLAGGTQR